MGRHPGPRRPLPPPRPFVPGFEASGRITAVGDGVDPDRIGTPVAALTEAGACAEVVLAPAALTLDVGDLPLRTAAGLGWGAPTAYDLINTTTRVRPGESVLIHAAAGSVGTLAAQFARLAGAAGSSGSRAAPPGPTTPPPSATTGSCCARNSRAGSTPNAST